MTKIISASIELSKLESAKFRTPKGADCLLIPLAQSALQITDKGQVFLNLSIFVNEEPDKFGKHLNISLSQTKEQRDAKADKVYIGSGKTVWEGESKKPAAAKAEVSNEFEDSQSLPF